MNLYKNRQPASLRFYLCLTSLVLILLSLTGFFRVVPVFDIFTKTIGYASNDFKNNINDFFLKLNENEATAKDNVALRTKVIQLQAELDTVKSASAELDSLRSLNKVNVTQYNKVEARKISAEYSDKLPVRITIDKGNRDGIKKGQLVINNSGSLIGRIDTTFEYLSTIKPYYTEDFKVPLKSSKTQSVLVDGEKDGAIAVQDVGQASPLVIGDLLYTSALNNEIRDGIYVGKIASVDKENSNRFYLETDVLNIEFLYILQ